MFSLITLLFTASKMSTFGPNKRHLREVLIFCFKWKKTAAEAHQMLVEIYSDNAPSDKTCREWF